MPSHVHAILERCNASRDTPDTPCAWAIRAAGPRVLVWNLGPGALGKSVPEIESWSLGLKVYRLLTKRPPVRVPASSALMVPPIVIESNSESGAVAFDHRQLLMG